MDTKRVLPVFTHLLFHNLDTLKNSSILGLYPGKRVTGRSSTTDIIDTNPYTQEQKFIQLFDDLPKIRNQARGEIIKSQDRQKKYHDEKNKRKEIFKIGDKVLYYNATKEKQWSGKLDKKWKGPYYIHEELLNGSYKIKELNGKILRTPVNGELLKKYNDRENFEPMVVI
jgi:hypothetical protein